MLNEVILESVGMYVPDNIVTNERLINEFLVKKLKRPEIIENLTGIREKHFVTSEDSVADMAIKAVLGTVKDFSIERLYYVRNTVPLDLSIANYVSVHRSPPTEMLIPEAEEVIAMLGSDFRFEKTNLYTVFGACAHFLSAVRQAYDAINSGETENAVIATSTDISRFLDWRNRQTAILFGDGACAFLLRAGTNEDRPKIISHYEEEDPSRDHLLHYARKEGNWYVGMPDGNLVFESAIEAIGKCLKHMETKEGNLKLSRDNIEHFIFHQANGSILDKAIDTYKIPGEKVHRSLERYGNTSAASVGITLYEALKEEKIKPGDKVFLCSFGAGFVWNYVLLQY